MFKIISLLLMKSSILVGGQAVIEGVMMRVPGAYATAVRLPDGTIKSQRHKFYSIIDKYNVSNFSHNKAVILLSFSIVSFIVGRKIHCSHCSNFNVSMQNGIELRRSFSLGLESSHFPWTLKLASTSSKTSAILFGISCIQRLYGLF